MTSRLVPAACLALVLGLGLGCDQKLMPERPVAYAPWEEGLTLGFENPNLAPELRAANRWQVRVRLSSPGPAGRLVTQTTTSLTGESEATFLQVDGGVSLGPDPDSRLRVLPRGFPHRVSRWEDRGRFHWVVGSAWVQLPGVRFAEPGGAQGVWVESLPVSGEGLRCRSLFLPGVGEAETLVWRDGRWLPVLRLVTRGFTDAPAMAAK